MKDSIILASKENVLSGKKIGFGEACALFESGRERPFVFIAAAADIRVHFRGRAVSLCSILNAKSGRCREDCKFCAQSAHYRTNIEVYPLLRADEMVRAASEAKRLGASSFGIVTSGVRITNEAEWDEILKAIKEIGRIGIRPCASLGLIGKEEARELKNAGLYRCHHNLETAPSYFKNICTTHDYEDDVRTILAAQEAGLSTCSGGIIGLGEDIGERIELALLLRDLGVDSVPVNILNPIPGTPLADVDGLPPMEILLTLAVFRFILPDRDIRLCGGKEKNLRQLLPLGMVAGASSLMTGNYLTTAGREARLDREMILDLGLETALPEG